MRLSGSDRILLNCGTFSLPDSLDGSMSAQGAGLIEQGLAEKDDVELVGETRFVTTEKGKAAVAPVGTYDSTEYEKQVLGGNAEGSAAVVQVNAGDDGHVDGSESAGNESKED